MQDVTVLDGGQTIRLTHGQVYDLVDAGDDLIRAGYVSKLPSERLAKGAPVERAEVSQRAGWRKAKDKAQ
jgi:hypothetical protein